MNKKIFHRGNFYFKINVRMIVDKTFVKNSNINHNSHSRIF